MCRPLATAQPTHSRQRAGWRLVAAATVHNEQAIDPPRAPRGKNWHAAPQPFLATCPQLLWLGSWRLLRGLLLRLLLLLLGLCWRAVCWPLLPLQPERLLVSHVWQHVL